MVDSGEDIATVINYEYRGHYSLLSSSLFISRLKLYFLYSHLLLVIYFQTYSEGCAGAVKRILGKVEGKS